MIKNSDITPGMLLVAPPAMQGTFWHKTVIMITEHHGNGSLGLVLNKRSTITIRDFGKNIDLNLDRHGYIHVGGPVNTKAFCMLHSSDWECSNTMRINEEFSLSSSLELLKRISEGDEPSYWRLFVGLCGWAPDQLLTEVNGTPPYNHNHSWLTTDGDYDTIFHRDQKEQWSHALEKCGNEFAQKMLL